MKPDFFYECLTCQAQIPATWDNIDPEGMQSVTVEVKKNMTETTFRCKDHHERQEEG